MSTSAVRTRSSWALRQWKGLKQTKYLQLMVLPALVFFVIFHYLPMYGVVIAFQDYSMRKGFFGSPWVGLENFILFLEHPYVLRLIRNTLLINFYGLLFSFPVGIVLAIFLNEVVSPTYKKLVQTVSYLPHFIATVAVVGMLKMILSPTSGAVNKVLTLLFGIRPIYFFAEPRWFRTLYIGSGIWQNAGWSAIIYIAALAGIDPQLYEAATIDGAGRIRRIRHVTLPGLKPTIALLLILSLGRMMSVGAEKILLMYNELTMEVADVISTFVYRRGLLQAQYSYGAAVGLLNSLINIVFLVAANRLSRAVMRESLW